MALLCSRRTLMGCSFPSLQDEVLVAGFGRKGHAVGDIPGVRFKVRIHFPLYQALAACMKRKIWSRETITEGSPALFPTTD